jgi:hypothetical protein
MAKFDKCVIMFSFCLIYSFAFEEHGNCPAFKDSPSDVYAHAAYPINGGGAHFDEGKTWTLNSNKGKSLVY